MKKLVYIMSLVSGFAASNYEFTKGIDLTGRTNVSTSQLNQLIDNAKTAANRGLVLTTNNTPDTTTYPYFTNYVWRDISTDPPTMKFYSTAGWVSAAIAPGSVITASIAAGAVTSTSITNGGVATVDLADNAVTTIKLADDAVNLAKMGNASVGRDELIAGAVDATKITNGTITGLQIAAGSISNLHFVANTINSNSVVIQGLHATNIANGTIDSNQLKVAGIAVTNIAAGASGTVLVSQGSSAPSWETNHILQIVTTNTLAVVTNGAFTGIAYGASPGNAVNTFDTTLVATITTKSASSKLKMDYTVNCGVAFSAAICGFALAIYDADTPVYITVQQPYDNNVSSQQFCMSGTFIMDSPGAASTKNYNVRVFPVTANALGMSINGKYDSTALFGGNKVRSSFSITEIR
jgi:hypothetical protein